MFLYWDGYEIDGSDTDFDIILPENVQINEFIECFLANPLFCKDREPIFNKLPSRSFNRGYVDSKERMSKAKFEEQLLTGNYSHMSIMGYCLYPEQLDAKLLSQVYSLSKTRKPVEEAYGKVENPCTEPANQESFMTLDLTIQKAKRDHSAFDYNCEGCEDAYRYNFSSTDSVKKGDIYFTLGIPVGSNYEYTMYIIKYMEEHFPSLKIWGGIECSCGATFGNSLYTYEKIQLSVQYNIKHFLKRLTEYGIRSCVQQNQKGKWTSSYSKKGFYLKREEEYWLSPPKEETSLDKYLEIVNLALSMELDYFEQISETAVMIELPPPSFYASNSKVEKELKVKLDETVPHDLRERWHNWETWLYVGYFAFVLIDGKPVCEFRVKYPIKEYFLTLLQYMESGLIDYIKEETYRWRNEED